MEIKRIFEGAKKNNRYTGASPPTSETNQYNLRREERLKLRKSSANLINKRSLSQSNYYEGSNFFKKNITPNSAKLSEAYKLNSIYQLKTTQPSSNKH